MYSYVYHDRNVTRVLFKSRFINKVTQWTFVASGLSESVRYLSLTTKSSGFRQDYMDLVEFESVLSCLQDLDNCYVYDYNKRTLTPYRELI